VLADSLTPRGLPTKRRCMYRRVIVGSTVFKIICPDPENSVTGRSEGPVIPMIRKFPAGFFGQSPILIFPAALRYR